MKEKIKLPWAMTTEGVSRFMRDWKNAADGREFMIKHGLSKNQWLKCQELAKTLRTRGINIKIMKVYTNISDSLDFEILKKVAADLDR